MKAINQSSTIKPETVNEDGESGGDPPPIPKEKTKVDLAKAAAVKAHKAYDSFAQIARATDENTEHNPCSWLPTTPSILTRSPLGFGATRG